MTHVAVGQRLNKKRPSVYLTFKEFVPRTSDENDRSKGVRLVLHNNTKWPISYGSWPEPVLKGDVSIVYIIQLETGCRVIRRHVDVITRGTLLPGNSISFVVPHDDFQNGSQIYVEFEFAWELEQGRSLPKGTSHRAYLFSHELPPLP